MNVFLIALDGADPNLVNEWIDGGHLENLRKIRDQGLSGKLESTFPPLTGPAWSSFHTGVGPGKHGVFGWLDLQDSYQGRVINRDTIKTKTIWREMSQQGEKVGLLSIPVTYPPEKVNGFVVPGFLTPSSAEEKSYPNSVINELREAVPDYEFCPEPFMEAKDEKKAWVAQMKEAVRYRGKASRYLYKSRLAKEDSATMAIHYFATDAVQHYLWDEQGWKPRLEVFEEVDKEIGKLLEMAPDNSKFIVLSDHGFGPLERTFNVNVWLRKEGLLSLTDEFKTSIKERLYRHGWVAQRYQPLGEKLYPIAKELKLIDNPVVGANTNETIRKLFLSVKDVDWRNTKAFCRSQIGQIRLNSTEEEHREQLRTEIMEKLRSMKVPGADKKVAEWVKPREEMYSGRYLAEAPDILFNPLKGSNCVGYGGMMFFDSDIFSRELHPGHHRRNGLLMAYGKGIDNKSRDASIKDLAPTVLNLSSCKIPKQMDGEVIPEIASTEPSYYQPDDFYREAGKAEKDEEIEERMKSLGYL